MEKMANRSKTREGGVMRLENLIADIDEEMFTKIVETEVSVIKMQEILLRL